MRINQQIPASFIRRSFAYITDLFVVFLIIITPFNYNLNREISFTSLKSLASGTSNIILITITIAILTILYWAIFEYLFSQSLGKMITNLQVISLKNKLTFSQTLLRNISKFSSTLLLIDCINMLISKTNQRFLEKASETQVVLK